MLSQPILLQPSESRLSDLLLPAPSLPSPESHSRFASCRITEDLGQKEWIPIKSDISALIRWEDHLVGEKVLSIRVYDETNCGPPLTLGGYSKWLWKV
ncbi:hypothetical protein R6Z07F_000075 [Ovis aries]